jgi:hypothetical protein
VKAIGILKEFVRLVEEEGLNLEELCEQTDLIKEVIKELEEIEKIHNYILDNFEDVIKMGNKELSINFAKFVEQIQKTKSYCEEKEKRK